MNARIFLDGNFERNFQWSGHSDECPTERAPQSINPTPRERERCRISSQLLARVRNFSIDDAAIILAIADYESGFNPSATNPLSSAHGIFQIINATWHGLGKTAAERHSISAQVDAGVQLFRENLRHLNLRGMGNVQGERRAIEMYRLHHDGPGSLDRGGTKIAAQHVVPKYRHYLAMIMKERGMVLVD